MNNYTKAAAVIALVAVMVFAFSSAADDSKAVAGMTDDGNFNVEYSIIEIAENVSYNIATITGYSGTSPDVTISLPLIIDGQEFSSVTLAAGAFSGKDVDSVTFSMSSGTSALSVESGAFDGVGVVKISDEYPLDLIIPIVNGVGSSGTVSFIDDNKQVAYSLEEGWLYKNGTSLAYVTTWATGEMPKAFTSIEYHGTEYLGPFSDSTIKSLTIPSEMTEIPSETFMGMASLEAVVFEGEVTSIGNRAFSETGLTSIDIPDTVESIGASAFYGCPLETIDLPTSLQDIDGTALMGCDSIRTITAGGNATYSNEYFSVEDGALYVARSSGTELMTVASEREEKSFMVKNGTDFIGQYAFAGSKLTSITLPESVTTLENERFDDCANLEALIAPGATEVGKSALLGCTSLEKLEVAQGCDLSTVNCEETSLVTIDSGDDVYIVVDGGVVDNPISWYKENGDLSPITTLDELVEFAAVVNSGIDDFKGRTVTLGADIDLGGAAWDPIGDDVNSFKGIFDGQDYEVTGLTISMTDTENVDLYLGLFGSVVGDQNSSFTKVSDLYYDGELNESAVSDEKYTAVVRNLVVSGVDVEASGSFVAAVSGYSEYALFSNVRVTDGTIVGTNSVGGIVGRGLSTVIAGCSVGTEDGVMQISTFNEAEGSIYNIGGIAGALRAVGGVTGYPSAVIDSVNWADLSVYLTTGGAGGIVGHSNGSALLIYGCENRGDVTITKVGTVGSTANVIAGGIAGLFQVNSDNAIVNSFNYGRISTADSVDKPAGALAGIANYYGGLVVGSGNYGEITGDAYYVAGIIGHGFTVTIENCLNEGAISLAEGNDVGYTSTICAGTTVATYKDMAFEDVDDLLDALVKAAKKAGELIDSGATVHLVGVTVKDSTGTLVLPEYLNVLTADERVCAEIVVGDRNVCVTGSYNNVILELGVPGAEVTVGNVYADDHAGQLTLSADGMLVTVEGQIGTVKLTAAVGMTVINNGTIGSVTSWDYSGPTDGTGITVYNGSESDATAQMGSVYSGQANMVFHNYGILKNEALDGGRYLISVGKADVSGQTNTFVLYNHSGAEIVGKTAYAQPYLFYMPGGQSIVLNIMEGSKLVNKTDSTSTWFMYYGLDGVNGTSESEDKGTLMISCASNTVFMGADGTTQTSITESMWVGSDDGDAKGEFVSPVEVTFSGFPDGAVITVIDSAGGELVVDGDSISLAPGDYTAVGALDGYVFVPRKFTVGSSAASVVLEAVLEIPTLGYEVRFTADGATITLTATHPIDGVQFQYYAASGSVGTMLEANTMNVEEDGTYSFYVLASVGRYIAQSLTVDVEVDLPTKQVEVQVSFPESTGIPAQVFLADRATFLYPSDVEVEGYTVEGFLKDGQPYSGPLYDDPVVLTAVLSLDAPDLTYTSVLTFDGIRVTLSASHALDDAELACYRVTDGDPVPVEGGVFTTDVSGDYVFYAVASAGGMTSESERVTVTVSYVAPAVTVPVESAVGYAGGGQLALNASASDQVTLTYGSSDPSVASVDGSGVVTMVSAGKATVSVIGVLPSGEELDPVTVSIEVRTAPAVEGVTFNPVTDATHEIVEQVLPMVSEVPGSALEGGDVAVFDLTGTGERFTLSYADLGWSHITADNWERYDFYLVHIDEGYDIPSFTAGADGITVQPDGFSPYVFISAEKSAEPTPEPEPQPAAVTVSDTWIYAALAILLVECAAIMLLNRRRA